MSQSVSASLAGPVFRTAPTLKTVPGFQTTPPVQRASPVNAPPAPTRPALGVVYTERHARQRDQSPVPEPDEETHDEPDDESAVPTRRRSPDPSSRLLLKNLRPRLVYLRPNDRILLELALTGERSKRDIARAMGVEPGTITRRLTKLISRLSSGLVNALLADHCPLDPDVRQLALEHFLGDQSQRELADLHRMTPGAVSRALQYVRGWYEHSKSPTLAPAPRPSRKPSDA